MSNCAEQFNLNFVLKDCHSSDGLYSRLIDFGIGYELWFDPANFRLYLIFEDRSMIIYFYTCGNGERDYLEFFKVMPYNKHTAEEQWPVYGYNIVVNNCIDVTSKFVYHFGKPEFLDNIAIWRGGTWGRKTAD